MCWRETCILIMIDTAGTICHAADALAEAGADVR